MEGHKVGKSWQASCVLIILHEGTKNMKECPERKRFNFHFISYKVLDLVEILNNVGFLPRLLTKEV